jgi:hypothetical protein
MSQADNSVTVTGKVVKGPFVSYVNNDTSKMRVKYQVQVESRKRDNHQTFTPWVRSMGNQAKFDYDHIKTGDMVTVHGRINTRYELKERYFKIKEDDPTELEEIIVDPTDDEEMDMLDEMENLFILKDRRLVAEVQAQDVRYVSMWLRGLTLEELERWVTPEVIKVAHEKAKEQGIELSEENE